MDDHIMCILAEINLWIIFICRLKRIPKILFHQRDKLSRGDIRRMIVAHFMRECVGGFILWPHIIIKIIVARRNGKIVISHCFKIVFKIFPIMRSSGNRDEIIGIGSQLEAPVTRCIGIILNLFLKIHQYH